MSDKAETAAEWSIRTWRERHSDGYFPNSHQHKDWKVFDFLYPWFLRLAAPVESDIAVEIGAGYGEWMIPLSKRVEWVWGVDIHQSLVNKAAELFAKHHVDNAGFLLNNGTGVPIADGAASLVYSISVFQHLPRDIVLGYVKESERLLKPGGRCVHHFRNAHKTGPYPTPARDIQANHTGDFSCGWTYGEITRAAETTDLDWDITDIGLHLVLRGRKR